MSWLSKAIGAINPVAAIGTGLLGGILGKKGGGGFTPKGAPLIDPFSQEQAKKLYEQTQSGLAQQQAFVNALAGQNALANQANVFRQLQDVASGVGPNPALAALQQATGQNIAAQSALMGAQRGGSRNVGLLARQAGMQGGALQQQAAGQGATLQAQQQLSALGQLGGLANQQVAQQQTGLAGLNQFGLQGQQNVYDAIARQNAVAAQQQSSLNQINAQIAADRAKQQSGLFGSIGKLIGPIATIAGTALGGPVGGAIGGTLGSTFSGLQGDAGGSNPFENLAAHGGMITKKPKYAMGGMAVNQPQSYVGQYFQNPNQMLSALNQSDNLKENNLDYSTLADGGAVYRDGNYAEGGMAPKSLMIKGGHVPGKAVVAGDSYQNDIVDAKLSPGEIVIPRSIVNHPNAAELAAKFVQDTLAKKGKSKKTYLNGGGLPGDENDNADYEDADAEETKYILDAQNKGMFDKPEDKSIQPKDFMLSSNVLNNNLYEGKDIKIADTGTKALPQYTAEQAYTDAQVEGPSTTEKGLRAVQGAFAEEARLEREKATENVKAITEAQDLIKAKNLEYEMHRQQAFKKIGDLEQDINNYKIDPKRFYSNMGTLEKMANVIGLIMGGIGEAGTGRENGALVYLENQIKNDIDLQKSELGKKQTLLEANYRDLGNMNEAITMTNAMLTNNLSREMDKVANQYAGTIQGARLKQAAGMLNAKTGSYIDQLAQYRAYTSPTRGTASTGNAGAGVMKQLPLAIDPKKETRIDYDGNVFYANNPAQKEKVLTQLNALSAAQDALTDMQKIDKLSVGTKIGGAGQEFLSGFVGEPGAFAEEGKQALENFKQRYAEAEAARLGIRNPAKIQLPVESFPSKPGGINITEAEDVKYTKLKEKLARDAQNILGQLSTSPVIKKK